METFALADYKTFKSDDRTYLFVVSQNAIFEADADTVEMLDRAVDWSKGSPRSRQDFLNRFPGSETEKKDAFERLGQIGLLTPAHRPLPAGPDPAMQNRMPVKT
ncbi:hypothetical protein N9934_03945, partial [Desulfosarcina sp.]|nr:hypothetical protein [Desulfosarcina sp.]